MNDNIQPEAMFKFSYGLYVLSASCDGKDNGCIINTAVQLTDAPKQVAIAVNKANLTHDMIFADGRFNLSFLSEQASFDLFKRFGFQSGRNADKDRKEPERPRISAGSDKRISERKGNI